MKIKRPKDRVDNGPALRPTRLPYDPHACKLRSKCEPIGQCLRSPRGCVTPYFRMSCGDLTCIEEQELSAYWRPKGKDWFCDFHGWVKGRQVPKRAELPDEPMF